MTSALADSKLNGSGITRDVLLTADAEIELNRSEDARIAELLTADAEIELNRSEDARIAESLPGSMTKSEAAWLVLTDWSPTSGLGESIPETKDEQVEGKEHEGAREHVGTDFKEAPEPRRLTYSLALPDIKKLMKKGLECKNSCKHARKKVHLAEFCERVFPKHPPLTRDE